MNIEGGGSSAGGGGPSISGGIGIGAGSGISLGSTIVNEGPVAPAFLENTMPIHLNSFKPVGEIIFNPFKEAIPQPVLDQGTLAEQEAVAEAEHWLGISSQDVHPLNNQQTALEQVTTNQSVSHVLPMLVYQPWIEPIMQPDIQPIRANFPKASRKVVQKAQPEAAPIPMPKEQSVVEEEVVVEEKREKIYEQEKEEVLEIKQKYLFDEEVALERVFQLGKAIELAQEDASKNKLSRIEGWRIIKFLKLHAGLLSQIVKGKGSDGSLDETVADFSARKFASENEAREHSMKAVFENEPVRRGKEGRRVTEGAVEKVLKYLFVKRGTPEIEVVARVIKKQKVLVTSGQPVMLGVSLPVTVKEPSIQDFPDLVEVFTPVEKAA